MTTVRRLPSAWAESHVATLTPQKVLRLPHSSKLQKTFRLSRTSMVRMRGTTEEPSLQDAQNVRPARPQPMKAPEE